MCAHYALPLRVDLRLWLLPPAPASNLGVVDAATGLQLLFQLAATP